ncbi:MAG: thymidylate synthase [Pseudomonadota bacterium]|nr:thymidylate synthase [Pseudomonadota bacterium]
MSRAPLAPPRMVLAPEVDDLFAFKSDHFHLADYEAHPHIAAPIAV